MAAISLTWTAPARPTIRRPAWFGALVHRAQLLRRRARRDRYLALIGRAPRRYPWLETMFRAMRGR